jgi:hypothetical protein
MTLFLRTLFPQVFQIKTNPVNKAGFLFLSAAARLRQQADDRREGGSSASSFFPNNL